MRNPVRITLLILLAALAFLIRDASVYAALRLRDPAAAPEYFGAFGLIGVDRRAAGYEDLIEFAEQLAEDRNYRELVVRQASRNDYGLQFVHVSTAVDRAFLPRLLEKIRRRFGRNSVISINACGKTAPEPGARALGIVAFRPIP